MYWNWGEIKEVTASDGTGGPTVYISNDKMVYESGISGDNFVTVSEKDSGGTNFWGETQTFQTSDDMYGMKFVDTDILVRYFDLNPGVILADVFSQNPIDNRESCTRYGIAQETKGNGQIGATLFRHISKQHSGLSPGSKYYVADDGSLSTTASEHFVGTALTTSDLCLHRNTIPAGMSVEASDDTAAAAAGVPIGGVYHYSGGDLRVRQV